MGRSLPTTFREIAAVRLITLALLVVCGARADCFAAGPAAGHLEVEVWSISCQGNGSYRIVAMVHNRSGHDIVVKESRGSFHAQTEVLGRWQDLRVSDLAPAAGSLITPGRSLTLAYRVEIPLTLRTLYRNGEGDINVMFRHAVTYVLGRETALRSAAGESSYWITPNTDTWVLREGM